MIERILSRRTNRENLMRIAARLRSNKELSKYDRDVLALVIEALMRRGRQPGAVAAGEFDSLARQVYAECCAKRAAECGRIRKRLPPGRWAELVEAGCEGNPTLIARVLSLSHRKLRA